MAFVRLFHDSYYSVTNIQDHVATISYKVEANTKVKANEQIVGVLTK